MELPLFDRVDALVRAMTPPELGELRTRTHRRGIKVWFDTAQPGKEHYEAQQLARRHVDGVEGVAVEIGFHSEHADPAKNQAVLDHLNDRVADWRGELGVEAVAAAFFDAPDWRRVSEPWLDVDFDDPELAFEVAARLVDYLLAIEPARRRPAS